jgi:hypothetical protein
LYEVVTLVSPRGIAIISLLCVAITDAIWAQHETTTTQTYDGALVVLAVTGDSDLSPVVVGVIASAIRSALEERGIIVVDQDELAGYRQIDPDLTLEADATTVGEGISIDYRLLLPDTSEPLLELNYSQSVGLDLSLGVDDSMDSVLDQGSPFFLAASRARATNPVVLEPIDSESPSADDQTSDSAETTPTDETGATGRLPRVEIAAGLAPLFAVGASSDYFSIAFGADLRVSVLLGERRRAAIGLTSRAIYSMAEGAATFVDLLLVPIGIEARISDNNVLNPTAYASAGAAVLHAAHPVLGTHTKLIPYTATGIGVKVLLFRGFAVAAQVDFAAYFEGSTVLLGFSPSVTVNMEL